MTQEQAASHLGISRPTLIAIEKGKRAATPQDIVTLSGFDGVTADETVRSRNDVVSFQPHLRVAAQRLKIDEARIVDPIREFQRLVDDYKELEDLVGDPLPLNFPPLVVLKAGIDPRVAAEDVADRERRRLGLGDEP
jgi:transcriptional regulator with XRE-family HTH domain